ncbi:MAG: hypothetical protein K8U57_32605 [Planctomycetes bacterium]|nr:hypothetical protein [Planctomycetota bacterium]
MRVPLLILAGLLFITAGCSRFREKAPTPAGGESFAQLGPVGLSVESVRHDAIRMRGMMGQMGESHEKVLTIKTRFKLIDTSTPVKQSALQRDGTMLGGGLLKVRDETGREFKPVGGFGFNAVSARRTDDAILTAENPEATDVLTFETVAGAQGDLILEVPANYQVKQSDGTFLQPKDPGTFKFRIPHAMWAEPPPATEAGPGNWATVGPVSVAIESVKVGKAKVNPFQPTRPNAIAETKDDVFSIVVKSKLANPAAKVKKPPFISDGGFARVSVTLKNKAGESYPVLTSFGFDKLIGRQVRDQELTPTQPEVTDLLTFDAKAASADEVFLTLWPVWEEQTPNNTWADPKYDDEFRFRIPKSMWAK